MKKVLLTLLTLFAVGGVWAQSTADVSGYTDDVMYAVGNSYLYGSEKIELPIYIKNVNNMSAGGFFLTLPEGLSFVADEEASDESTPLGTTDANHTLMGRILSDTEAHIVLFSGKASVFNEEVCVLTLAVDNSVIEADKEYQIIMHDQNLGNDSGKEVFQTDNVVSTIVFNSTLVFDENKTVQPIFNDGDKAKITINRTLVGGAWNTICLPFPMNSSATKNLFGEGAEFAQFSGWSIDYMMADDGETPIFKGINVEFTAKSSFSAMSSIAAGVPFLVKPKADMTVIELDNATLKKAGSLMKNAKVDGEENDQFPGLFVGTFVYTQVPEKCVFINSDKFYYSTGKTNIKGFRGWFNFGEVVLDSYAGSGDAKFSITVDGEATEIEGIPSYQRVTEGVYDLSGRKIQLQDGDLNKLQKGVYIINGKKVTIK